MNAAQLQVEVHRDHTLVARLLHPLVAELAIGREALCDVVLRSSTVSRRHAVLRWTGRHFHVADRSANGTYVNEVLLHAGERDVEGPVALAIGPYKVRVALPADRSDKVADRSETAASDEAPAAPRSAATLPSSDMAQQRSLRRRLKEALPDTLDLVALEREGMTPDRLRLRVQAALRRLHVQLSEVECGETEVDALMDDLCDELLGLGPIDALMDDPRVTEIMLLDAATLYAERDGRIRKVEGVAFTDDEAVLTVIERILRPLGRRIDASSPMVDARLADGSRVNAVIPPLALRGPCITIRKFPEHALSVPQLLQLGAFDEAMSRFLVASVRLRRNIVIAGGTGSGKTTLLNVLAGSIPEHERVVTIEDAAELDLGLEHVVSLESRPPNLEGKGAITIRDLVRNALRMRPDRIVVGECRGGEALDMLQAMSTGHDGSMTTVHASTPAEVLTRLETLCLQAGQGLTLAALRGQIAASVDLIVQQQRASDGKRRVTSVCEVGPLEEDGQVVLHELFVYRPDHEAGGHFDSTGRVPSFIDLFAAEGLDAGEIWR